MTETCAYSKDCTTATSLIRLTDACTDSKDCTTAIPLTRVTNTCTDSKDCTAATAPLPTLTRVTKTCPVARVPHLDSETAHDSKCKWHTVEGNDSSTQRLELYLTINDCCHRDILRLTTSEVSSFRTKHAIRRQSFTLGSCLLSSSTETRPKLRYGYGIYSLVFRDKEEEETGRDTYRKIVWWQNRLHGMSVFISAHSAVIGYPKRARDSYPRVMQIKVKINK